MTINLIFKNVIKYQKSYATAYSYLPSALLQNSAIYTLFECRLPVERGTKTKKKNQNSVHNWVIPHIMKT